MNFQDLKIGTLFRDFGEHKHIYKVISKSHSVAELKMVLIRCNKDCDLTNVFPSSISIINSMINAKRIEVIDSDIAKILYEVK